MSLVFKARADGLGPTEKLLLLAYANYTDAHGYCWPSEKRLAHSTGASVRTVQRTKARLTDLKLIKSIRRRSPKTGDPISNLTRVNLVLLQSLSRTDEDYGDDLVDQIVFGPEDHEPTDDLLTRHPDGYPEDDDTPPDLLTRQDDGSLPSGCRVGTDKMAGPSRQDDGLSISDPPEISLSHPPGAEPPPQDNPPAEDERADGIGPTDADAIYEAYATAYRTAFQASPISHQIHSDAETLLAAGWPVDHLVRLVQELPAKGYASLTRHAEHNPPPKAPRARLQLPPPCAEHVGPDLPMRMDDTTTPIRKCPLCNPYADDYRGPRMPLPTGAR